MQTFDVRKLSELSINAPETLKTTTQLGASGVFIESTVDGQSKLFAMSSAPQQFDSQIAASAFIRKISGANVLLAA